MEDVSEEVLKPAEEDGEKKVEEEKILQLPLSKVKRIVKSKPDVNIIQGDAVVAISKSAELFIEFLTEESYAFTMKDGRKGLADDDVRKCIQKYESLRFLDDCLPQNEKNKRGKLAHYLGDPKT